MHCTCFQTPAPLSKSTIIISYATLPLLSFFLSSFVAIIFIAFFVCPCNLLFQPTSYSLVFASGPLLCCACLLTLPSDIFIYGICLPLNCLFYPTSHRVSPSLILPLPLLPHFLAVGCSVLICSFFVLLLL